MSLCSTSITCNLKTYCHWTNAKSKPFLDRYLLRYNFVLTSWERSKIFLLSDSLCFTQCGPAPFNRKLAGRTALSIESSSQIEQNQVNHQSWPRPQQSIPSKPGNIARGTKVPGLRSQSKEWVLDQGMSVLVSDMRDFRKLDEVVCRQFFFVFQKFLEDISPFCGATDTPFMDFWWCLFWISKPE